MDWSPSHAPLPFDVVIIGGGPAGGAAATLLARAERRVLLLEKEACAHHKVCGEFISPEAQYYLEKLGIDLPVLGAKVIDHVSIAHGAKMTRAALPFTAMSLSRRVLDEQILQAAIKSGARVKRGVHVVGIERARGEVKVHLSGNEKGHTICAPAVFLATGKHDLRGWQRPPSIQNDLVGLKMHFRLGSRKIEGQNDVVIALFDGGYAGLEAIEDNVINLCLVVSKRRFAAFNHSWELLFDDLVRQAPLIAGRLEGAEPRWAKPLAIYGIPYGFVHREKSDAPGLYRLGDQMAVIPSFFGNGISIALHSAFLAVENYLHANEASYHRRLASELSPKLSPAALLSRIMVAPLAQPLIFLGCRAFPWLVRAAAANTRLEVAR